MFARELIAQLDAINELPPPPSPEQEVREGETVVGKLDDDLQQLWALRLQYKVKMENLARRYMHGMIDALHNPRAMEELDVDQKLNSMALAELKYEAVSQLFWAETKERFLEACEADDNIAIRRDWQVVTFKDGPAKLRVLLSSPFFPL